MEWETQIPAEVFGLLSCNALSAISKTRYYVTHGKHLLEIDIYHGEREGLCTMECEFKNELEISSFTLPSWAQDAVDITNAAEYKNANMAY